MKNTSMVDLFDWAPFKSWSDIYSKTMYSVPAYYVTDRQISMTLLSSCIIIFIQTDFFLKMGSDSC